MTDDTALQLLADAFLAEHAADAGRRLEQFAPEDGVRLLHELTSARAGAIIQAMAPRLTAQYLGAMKVEAAAAIVETLPVDLAARVLRQLDRVDRERLLRDVADPAATSIRALAEYREDSVAAHTDARDWTAATDWTVSDARKRLREVPLPQVYVVNRSHEVVGVIEAESLRNMPAEQRLVNLARHDVARLRGDASISSVLSHSAWLEVDLLPVVDATNKLLGLLRHRTVRRATAGAGTATPANAMIQAIVGLSELYWTGMSSVLTGISTQRTIPEVGGERTDR